MVVSDFAYCMCFFFVCFFFLSFSFQYGCDPSDICYASRDGRNLKKEHEQLIKERKTVLLLRSGVYVVEKADLSWNGLYYQLNKPVAIYGQGCGKTTLKVGLKICGMKSDGIVKLQDLKIYGSKKNGLTAGGGMDVIVKRCTVQVRGIGVVAYCAHISCEDLQVIHGGDSGVCASGHTGCLTLSGENTNIHNNVQDKQLIPAYGLDSSFFSAKIQLIAPLTKEKISTGNRGGGNWGGPGTIEQISSEEAARQEAARQAAREEAREAAREAARETCEEVNEARRERSPEEVTMIQEAADKVRCHLFYCRSFLLFFFFFWWWSLTLLLSSLFIFLLFSLPFFLSTVLMFPRFITRLGTNIISKKFRTK